MTTRTAYRQAEDAVPKQSATLHIADVARVTMQPLSYRVVDAGKMLGVGRTTIFEMIRSGRLEARKIGAATVVTHDSIVRVFQDAELSDATKRAHAAMT